MLEITSEIGYTDELISTRVYTRKLIYRQRSFRMKLKVELDIYNNIKLFIISAY